MLLAGFVLAVGLLVLMNSSVKGLRTIQAHSRMSKAGYLANALLEEIRTKRWDENPGSANGAIDLAQASSIGLDAGENANDKRTFDDIDDFDGWVELNVPQDASGTPLTNYSGYTRRVQVRYVDLPDAGGAMITAGDGRGSVKTNYKFMEVTVEWTSEGQLHQVRQAAICANIAP